MRTSLPPSHTGRCVHSVRGRWRLRPAAGFCATILSTNDTILGDSVFAGILILAVRPRSLKFEKRAYANMKSLASKDATSTFHCGEP